MRYFPIFADLDNADVLVVGGGEQAAQKVRLLRKTERAHHGRGREPSPTSCASWSESNAHLDRAARRSSPATSTASASSMPPPATACSMPPCRAPPRRAAFPSTSSTRRSSPPSSRRPSSTAIPSRSRSAPKAPRPCWRARSRPGSRPGCPPTSARSPSARRRCASRVAKAVPDARARRRLWERLLQGPFRRAVLSGAEAEAGRILAAELQGEDAPAARPRSAAWR